MAKAATAKMKNHVKIAVKNDGEGVSCGTGRAVVWELIWAVYISRYMKRFTRIDFLGRKPATLRFFQEHLDYQNQDGILMLIHIRLQIAKDLM
jgi:hypothetical protein